MRNLKFVFAQTAKVHFKAQRQRQRLRDALLQMGYLADLSGRPMLCTLVMTAAWALGSDSGATPKRHPFLRQSLRKAVEVAIAL